MTKNELLYVALLQATEEGVGISLAKFADICIEWATNEAIDKACEWLEKKACLYVWENCEQGEHGIHKTMLEDFRKAMKGE